MAIFQAKELASKKEKKGNNVECMFTWSGRLDNWDMSSVQVFS